MPPLLETQDALLRAILLGEHDAAAPEIVSDALAADDRLSVYRNTFLATLTKALRLSYPAVLRLVGEAFFDAVAQDFIQAQPPRVAYLNAYGGDFPAYLAQVPAAASLPYLGDVASLEWAVNSAFHARDVRPLDAHAIARIADAPPERLAFIPHPSLSLLALDYPADAIWRAVLAEDDNALQALDPSAGLEWLLVERTPQGVEVHRLPESEWRFLAALCAGENFAQALRFADAADAPRLLAQHLTAGRFSDFRLDPPGLENVK